MRGHLARAHSILALVAALAAVSAGLAQADIIRLKNGRTIKADRVWVDGGEVRYQSNGGTFGIPRDIVASIDAPTTVSQNPTLEKARTARDEGRPAEALDILQAAVREHPTTLVFRQELASLFLDLGDAVNAHRELDAAIQIDPQNARNYALMGMTLGALGDSLGAERAYRQSLKIQADPSVEQRLAALRQSSATGASAQFTIRYDGSINEPLGAAVLASLGEAFKEFEQRFGSRPHQPVTVVLQTEATFREDVRNPPWASGINDGTIRAPVGGLDRVTPGLLRVLRHELAHSFLASATGGNCPTWLQEGVARWLEGGDPTRDDALVAAAAQAGHPPSLAALDQGFAGLSADDANLAYAQSLSAVAHLLRTRGEPGLTRLIAALNDGMPAEEAFVVSLALSYREFQDSWLKYLLSRPAPR